MAERNKSWKLRLGGGIFLIVVLLFLDSHVEFAKRAYRGVDGDNIYTSWDGADKARGKPAVFGDVPADLNDSLLVNDPVASAKTLP
jgi:hypothetical protein